MTVNWIHKGMNDRIMHHSRCVVMLALARRDVAMDKHEAILDWLASADEDDIIDIHNALCESHGDSCAVIHRMDEFDDYATMYTPSDLIRNIDDFDTDDWFFVDGINGFESFDDIYDVCDDYGIADFIVENDDDCGFGDLRDILDDDDLD